MEKTKPKKFISIIWGYSRNMYFFSPEENYHLHALKVAKSLGYSPVVLIKQVNGDIQNDPNFDKDIEVWEYKNLFNYLWQILKNRKQLFYVNSYEWRSFLVPFLVNKSVFMGHGQIMRSSAFKKNIQKFVFNFFSRIRLNNEYEEEYLIKTGIDKNKLFIAPLAVSNRYFYKEINPDRKNLVYFGNVTPTKNLSNILKAARLVVNKYKDVKLAVVGNIIDESFWLIVDALGLRDNIFHVGFLHQAELSQELNKFAIALNSSFSEGQCVAVYDAALCGCALCLPNIMSFGGVFRGKALFHEVNDPKKLAENIIFFLENPDIADAYNEKCREMIISNYNIETINKKLKILFTYD